MNVIRVQNKDHWGHGNSLRANIKLPSRAWRQVSNLKRHQGSLSTWKRQQGNFFSGGEIKHKNVTSLVH